MLCKDFGKLLEKLVSGPWVQIFICTDIYLSAHLDLILRLWCWRSQRKHDTILDSRLTGDDILRLARITTCKTFLGFSGVSSEAGWEHGVTYTKTTVQVSRGSLKTNILSHLMSPTVSLNGFVLKQLIAANWRKSSEDQMNRSERDSLAVVGDKPVTF